MRDLTTQQRLDLRRFFDDQTLVEAVDAACHSEAAQEEARLLGESLSDAENGPNPYLISRYGQRTKAFREVVAVLRKIAKQPVQP